MINLSLVTEALAQRVATAKRLAVDDAIRQALEVAARAEGLVVEAPPPRAPSAEAKAARIARFEEIARAAAALPLLDARPMQDIVDELNEP